MFDPTKPALFDMQRQQFDWQLLQNGSVHRFDTRFELGTAVRQLTELGYLAHVLDASTWTELGDVHDALAAALSFPSWYGGNLDAFNDLLGDVANYSYGSDPESRGTVLAVSDYDTVLRTDRRTGEGLLDIFASQARRAALYGHAMLCLVHSEDPDLGPVGGRSVYRATVDEVPPDPPEPFDERTIVDFQLEIFAFEADAERYVAQLASAVMPVFADRGRYQVLAPVRVSDVNEQTDPIHRNSHRRREPGQQLFSVSFGFRGVSDRSELGDDVLTAINSSRLGFERMTETSVSGDDLKVALSKYSDLRW